MSEIQDRVREAVATLEQEVAKMAEREKKKKVRLRPHPPATSEEIAKYEEFLGLTLPPSYRAFLECHNGYDWLVYPGHMLSIQAVMPDGELYEEICEWKRDEAEYGNSEVVDAVVIANLGEPSNWAFLDPNQPGENGELTVVRWLGGDTNEYADLTEFFAARVRLCRRERPSKTERDAEGDEESP